MYVAGNDRCENFTLLDLWGIAHEDKRIPSEEQYSLIMECRQSGFSSDNWVEVKKFSFGKCVDVEKNGRYNKTRRR